MPQVKIRSGEYEFIGTLLEKEAPATCAAFKKLLPLRSQFIHVRWSGEGIWIPYGDTRLGLDCENHTSHPPKGEMLLYPGGISEMELILSYGRCCFASQYGMLAAYRDHSDRVIFDLVCFCLAIFAVNAEVVFLLWASPLNRLANPPETMV